MSSDMEKFDRQWKLIQMLLDAEASGKPVNPAISKRTLFGTRGSVEVKMDEIAAEMEARSRANHTHADETDSN